MDACSLIMVGFDGVRTFWARMTFSVARLAIVEVARVLKVKELVVAQPRLNSLDYERMRTEAYLAMGRYEDAIRALERSVSRFGNVITLHLDLIASYVELGRNEEAQAEAAEVTRLNPNFSLADQRRVFSAAQKKGYYADRFYADLAKAGLT
jgi:tetratricopeptide (TPR) repeat protein